MIPAIIIISLAFGWFLIETDFMRVRLPVGTAKPIDKSVPYWWQSNKDSMILCQGCRTKCHKSERWTAWKLPARTIKAYGSTINFVEGCNVYRAKLLKEIAKAQKSTALPHYKAKGYHEVGLQADWHNVRYEPTIDILIDGELKASINGNFKKGIIKQAMKV